MSLGIAVLPGPKIEEHKSGPGGRVCIGQVYGDCDSRFPGRSVKVIGIEEYLRPWGRFRQGEFYAVCTAHIGGNTGARAGAKVKIATGRLTSSDYRLISEVPVP